jgi:hypothetical protein
VTFKLRQLVGSQRLHLVSVPVAIKLARRWTTLSFFRPTRTLASTLEVTGGRTGRGLVVPYRLPDLRRRHHMAAGSLAAPPSRLMLSSCRQNLLSRLPSQVRRPSAFRLVQCVAVGLMSRFCHVDDLGLVPWHTPSSSSSWPAHRPGASGSSLEQLGAGSGHYCALGDLGVSLVAGAGVELRAAGLRRSGRSLTIGVDEGIARQLVLVDLCDLCVFAGLGLGFARPGRAGRCRRREAERAARAAHRPVRAGLKTLQKVRN